VFENGALVATVSGTVLKSPMSGLVPGQTYAFAVQAVDPTGSVSTNGPTAAYVAAPPSATLLASPINRSVATSVYAATSFLYTGSSPIQQGVSSSTIVPSTAAVVSGHVYNDAGAGLPGVTVTVVNHPEFGTTYTQSDGAYDLAVNGGQVFRLAFSLSNYLPAERTVNVPWEDYATVRDVVLIPLDPRVTSVDLTSATMQVARGTPSTDSSGTRQATVLFPVGTQATMKMPDGSTQGIAGLHVRATEYTVGPSGVAAMPADLPAASMYTYAVELSADEELAAGALTLLFSQPVPVYIENFLSLPVGTAIPAGAYDRQLGAWVPSNNGVVIDVLSVTNGAADVDINGDGKADTGAALTAIGVTDAERQQLASLYTPGQSLWRVALPHFSEPWDFNFGFGPPPDGGGPNGGGPSGGGGGGPGPCDTSGSVIACQRQALGEQVAVAGTPYLLRYDSDRQRDRQATLQIPLTGATLVGPVVSIERDIDIAGRHFTQTFPAQTNQTSLFTWDGTDAFGRFLQGAQPVTVTVGNTYNAYYEQTDKFGHWGNGQQVTANVARQQTTVSSTWQTALGVWDEAALGLGGWTLNVHDVYDVNAHTIYFGDGTELTPSSLPGVIQTIAGTGGGQRNTTLQLPTPATAAAIAAAQIAVAPDRSLYISAMACVLKMTPDGILHFFAGQCSTPSRDGNGFSGDGGPATSAQLSNPWDVAVGPDGSVFIGDSSNNRIRRVAPDGTITTVAGNGQKAFSGDGGPATAAALNVPAGIDVAPDGTLYIADTGNNRIRRVSTDGIIDTAVFNGGSDCCRAVPSAAPATSVSVWGSLGGSVRIGPDGSIYTVESGANGGIVRRVGPDGLIRPFAGNGGASGYGGDGGPATAASFAHVNDAAVGPDGSVYISDGNEVIRRVDPSGIISTVAGLVGNVNQSNGDNGPALKAAMLPGAVRVGPDRTLYISESNKVRSVGPALLGFTSGASTYTFASKDGTQIFTFDGNGRHLTTVDALTHATLYQFSYDGAGRLIAVADVNGDVTQITHDASGKPVSIVGPFGQQTALTADAHGYLASVTDPTSATTAFTYDPNGLMMTMTDARGGLHQFAYDAQGRLTDDQDPAGGSKVLTRNEQTNGFSVTVTTGLGRQTTYQTQSLPNGNFSRVNTMSDGTQDSVLFTPAATTSTTYPDGTTVTESDSPDPRFGVLSPLASVTTKTPSGLTLSQALSRSVTLSNGNLTTLTEKTNLNGNTWTRVFNASNSTWTTTSPVGRTTTMTVDSADRPIQVAVPGIAPITLVYDSHGRLQATTQGSNTWTNGYDTSGYLSLVTDPLSHTTSYTNDLMGRPTQTQFADNRLLGTAYDGDSNTTGVTLPSGQLHSFTFTPVDLIASYTPPSVSSASPTTQYVYDLDRNLKTVTRPDGATLTYGYDSAGRLQTTTIPEGAITLAYNAPTGHLQSATAPSGEAIAYAFDGFLKTGETWSGPVAGSLSLGFDNNFRMTSQTVNGTALGFGYDADGLLTGAGAITLMRNAQNGQLTGTTLGSVTDSYGYDSNGRFASYTAAYNGNTVYSESVVRDAVGRITKKTETVLGTTHVWGYTFDATGRLTDVTEDGSFFSHYGYDADDNRTTYTNTSGTANPTYDAQDRLTAYGSATYGYTLNGELSSKTVNGQTTSYTYDPLGNLLHVGPPTGSAIDYLVDGENRRVGKEVGGALTTGFLYKDGLNVVAQLDGSGNLAARYVFGSKPNVPDYYTTSAGTFRILSDHLGSPRLIVNASSGAVVEEIDYDEFGNVTNDTAPGTIPFGFAGGLYDKDTGLVRFWARDYDPHVGRWTSKDPTRFGGGPNFYVYASNDPIDRVDPLGLDPPWWDSRCFDQAVAGFLTCIQDEGWQVPPRERIKTCAIGALAQYLSCINAPPAPNSPPPPPPPPPAPPPTCP
jgi:RHS repeat-associated protein